VDMLTVEIGIPEMEFQELRFLVKHLLDGAAKGATPAFIGPGALPPLYSTNVVYREDATHGSGIERFKHPRVVLAQGYGDCDQLVWYRLAELLAQGVPAETTIADYQSTGAAHAQIRLPRDYVTPWSYPSPHGPIEDPSIILGAENHWPPEFTFDQ